FSSIVLVSVQPPLLRPILPLPPVLTSKLPLSNTLPLRTVQLHSTKPLKARHSIRALREEVLRLAALSLAVLSLAALSLAARLVARRQAALLQAARLAAVLLLRETHRSSSAPSAEWLIKAACISLTRS